MCKNSCIIIEIYFRRGENNKAIFGYPRGKARDTRLKNKAI